MQTIRPEVVPQDIETISQQLGRPPRGLRSVAVRTEKGLPVVLQIAPVVDGELFPTLFWLCSKDLYKAIAEIETAGFVKILDGRLGQDESLRQQLFDDHKRYAALRTNALTIEEKTFLEQKSYDSVLAEMGVGVSRNWHTVRCLHMHYAHHLAEKNCIGEILDNEFQLNELSIEK